ncbi:hypothetical protein [Sphingomonas sp. ACRSK]|uniref:hypothetical protein n=1 Tax=Sphingomonas sp. ACRSK TaxID=2918213 RepID=UPI001EF529DE|nr:hypothetical protein [Sphingomonas sp. ACRSK]MCG7348207.1 hypothetical protein [Sphingomonas sp. ACRSK]
MQITAEWAAVVLTALGMGGAAGSYIERRLQGARAALPIIRADWHRGTKGFSCKLDLANRLDEDLIIERAECATEFVETTPILDSGGSIAGHTAQRYPSPREVGLTIDPRGSGKLSLSVEGAKEPARVTIIISSSARTLRSKRLTLRPSQEL